MTTREIAEQILAKLEIELGQDPAWTRSVDTGQNRSDDVRHGADQMRHGGVVVGTGLTQDHGDWRVIVYVQDGAELPTRLRAFLDAQRDRVELVESGPFELE